MVVPRAAEVDVGMVVVVVGTVDVEELVLDAARCELDVQAASANEASAIDVIARRTAGRLPTYAPSGVRDRDPRRRRRRPAGIACRP